MSQPTDRPPFHAISFDQEHWHSTSLLSDEIDDPVDDEYESIKRIRRRMPIPVTRVVGPHIRESISL